MRKPEIILIGAGGHAQACIDVLEQQNHYKIAGLIGKPDEIGKQYLGYSVIASDNGLSELAKIYQNVLIAVGQIQSPDTRIRLYKQVSELGFNLPTIVSPAAYVSSHARIGTGTIVMHGAIINAGAKVGDNCIINSRALIEHGVTVHDHCHISTGSILNGDVNVGSGCFVGSNTTIKEGVSLQSNCVVGMGLSVRHHLVENARYISDKKIC